MDKPPAGGETGHVNAAERTRGLGMRQIVRALVLGAGAAGVALILLATPSAIAQEYGPGQRQSTVGGVDISRSATAPADSTVAGSTLPSTGSGHSMLLVRWALALVAAGATLVVLARNRLRPARLADGNA